MGHGVGPGIAPGPKNWTRGRFGGITVPVRARWAGEGGWIKAPVETPMSLYTEYLEQIATRSEQGLHPKPIDDAALLNEIIDHA
mgnify:CR=1 FL=1